MADASLKQVLEFFGKKEGQSLSEFTAEWKALDPESQQHIRAGIGDGSLTY
jgi:hypothetical protein